MDLFGRFSVIAKNDIHNLKYRVQKAEQQLMAVPRISQFSGDDVNDYIEPIKYNDKLILDYWERSIVLNSIADVIVKECTKQNWEIKPMFNFKCINCNREYDNKPENEKCDCGGKLIEPNIEHKNILSDFIDDPNPLYDFYEISRSCLVWLMKLDRYYVSISFIYDDNGEKKLNKSKDGKYLPTGLFVEDAQIIRIRDKPNEKFCPLCYKPDVFYKNNESSCPKCGTELWETFYVALKNPNSREIKARFSKLEIIEGHRDRHLPDLYGTPKVVSAIRQLQATFGLDNMNSDIFVKRKVNKFIVFPGATQSQVDEISGNIENKIKFGDSVKKYLMDIYLGATGSSDIKIYDALPDAEKLQSLEWYKFYRDAIYSAFGIPPVFAGTIESGKAGNNPNIQDTVMGGTAKSWIRPIEEPFNKRLMECLGVTDYYIAWPEFTHKDELREAQIQKLNAETANIFLTAGFSVQYIDNSLVVSKEPDNRQEQEPKYIDVEEVMEDPDKMEKFEALLKKNNTLSLKNQ